MNAEEVMMKACCCTYRMDFYINRSSLSCPDSNPRLHDFQSNRTVKLTIDDRSTHKGNFDLNMSGHEIPQNHRQCCTTIQHIDNQTHINSHKTPTCRIYHQLNISFLLVSTTNSLSFYPSGKIHLNTKSSQCSKRSRKQDYQSKGKKKKKRPSEISRVVICIHPSIQTTSLVKKKKKKINVTP